MSNVALKQVYLSIANIKELSNIIFRELTKNPNTQIFVDNSLYYELAKNSKSYCIWVEKVYKGFQYNDEIEKAFLFQKDKETLEFVFQMNFVSCCNEFKQLTYFGTKGIKYTHFLVGMENILVIRSIWPFKTIYFY